MNATSLHTLFLHLGQKLVQDHHLATVHHQVEVGCVGGSGLGAVKQVRVVAALPQLHEDVQQTHLVHLASRVKDVDVLHQNLCVPDGSEPRTVQSAALRLPPGLNCEECRIDCDAYHSRCILLRPTYILISFFGSSVFSTSAFIRRSRKGRRT